MKYSYGLDFGTTNSTIAVVDENNKLQKIAIDPKTQTPSVMRSIIYVSPEGEFLYGKAAIDAYSQDVREGKGRTKKTLFTGRFITVTGDADIHGVKNDDLVEELIEFDEFEGGRMLQGLKSVLANPNVTEINLFGKKVPIEKVVGGFLKEMKKRADDTLGQNVTSVVLGRPVRYVGDNEKLAVKRMKSAGEFAGFKDISFEYEPIAAAYDFGSTSRKKQTALIFDFGGGTLDVSIVSFPRKKVLANVGLAIGGDYFNSKIFSKKLAVFFGSESTYGPNKAFMPGYLYLSLRDWYKTTLLKTEKFDEQIEHFRFMSSDPESIDALASLVNNNLSFSLYDEIDRAKRMLSEKEVEPLQFLAENIDIKTEIKKTEFEQILVDNIHDIEVLLNQALDEANLAPKDIDAVSTTGGSSLIPVVRELLEKKFGKEKITKSDAFTSVAGGLALRAQELYTL